MKICMMTNTYLPHVGGVARSVSTFAEEYLRLGHEVLVVAPEFDGKPLPAGTLLKATLDLWAVGVASATITGPGTGFITFEVSKVELVDVTPDPLESVLECLILSMLQGLLTNVQLPFSGVTVDMFTLSLTRGPETETDEAKLYGDIM